MRAAYRIVPHEDGWGVEHEGTTSGPYLSKEGAFEAAGLAAMNAIKQGHAILVSVPGRAAGEATLGIKP